VFGSIALCCLLILYLSPIPTFVRIIKKKSIGNISILPYATHFVKASLLVAFAFALEYHDYDVSTSGDVSRVSADGTSGGGSGSARLLYFNIIGVIVQLVWISICIWYSVAKWKALSTFCASLIIVLVCLLLIPLNLKLHFTAEKKLADGLLWSVCVLTILMYTAPMLKAIRVIRDQDSSSLSLLFSSVAFLNCCCWSVYSWFHSPRLLGYFVASVIGAVLALMLVILKLVFIRRQPSMASKSKKGSAVKDDAKKPLLSKNNDLEKSSQELVVEKSSCIADDVSDILFGTNPDRQENYNFSSFS
jgi:solute carrier family 50 (sugar transporter)